MKNTFKLILMLGIVAVVTLTFVACKKDTVEPVGKYTFKESMSNPYGTVVAGGSTYYLTYDNVSADSSLKSYLVWVNPTDATIFDGTTVYYEPNIVNLTIRFGSQASMTFPQFKTDLEQKIAKDHYAIVKSNWQGGPSYASFEVEEW